MLNLSDKELDRLSREAAERYEVDHDPASWTKLEKRLDRELGSPSPLPRLPGPRSPFLYLPAAILFVGITFFLLKTPTHTSTFTQKSNHLNASPGNNQTPGPGIASGNGTSTAPLVTSPVKNTAPSGTGNGKQSAAPLPAGESKNARSIAATGNEKKDDGLREKNNRPVLAGAIKQENAGRQRNASSPDADAPQNQQSETGKNYTANTTRKNGHNKKRTPYGDSNNNNFSTPENNGRSNDAEEPMDKSAVETGKYDRSSNNNSPAANAAIVSALLQPINYDHRFGINDRLMNRLKTNGAAVKQGIVRPGKKNSKGLYTNRSLQFGLLFSPDFSEVRYNYNNRVGSNIGITVSYQLAGNFSINTGFIFTKKHYDADGFDFHLPANCGIDQQELEFAISTSHMYEIPLNIRYDVNKSGNNTLFISAGLSSYIMKKESFAFFLHDYNMGYRRWQDATYKTNNGNWFSVLNLSAGFETKISNSLSVQAEPYLKLPVTGVGFGNVNLSSYGLNISLKYAPMLKKTRR